MILPGLGRSTSSTRSSLGLIDHLSYSGLNTYVECGEKFRLTKIVKVPEMPGWALIGGRAVHTTTENIDWLETTGEIRGPTTFIECFDEEIAKQLEESGIPSDQWRISGKVSKTWPNKEDEAWWRYHGQSFVDNYVHWRNRYPGMIWITPEGTPAIEIKVDANLGGADVTGFIDRIFQDPDTTLRVVDIKAGRTTPTGKIQLSTYAWSLPSHWPRPVTGSYFMARPGLLIGNYSLELDQAQLKYEYGGAFKAIQQGYFPAKTGFMCGYCPVKDYCWAKDGEMAEAVKPF
jgi:PD-(D/E)XK nuclease superfamily